MNERLYLDIRESLKLKKIIEHLEAFLFHEDTSRLNFSISRNHLKELCAPLSPVSRTKTLLKELLMVLEKTPFQKSYGQRSIELIEELRKMYQLETLQFKKMEPAVQGERD